MKKNSQFFALYQKNSPSLRFAQEKNFSPSLRFALGPQKKFALASLSHWGFGANLEPWIERNQIALFQGKGSQSQIKRRKSYVPSLLYKQKRSVSEPRKKNILLEKDEISEENWSTLELEMTFNEEKTNCSSPNLFVAKESG